eukprot:2908711-Rhodomonas_salina.1
MEAIKDLHLKHWQIYYETPLQSLPVPFSWLDEAERTKEEDRQPDGVAFNTLTKELFFLECTCAMDHPHNLTLRALGVKSTQYSAAEDA